MLDLSSLSQALNSLERGIERAQGAPGDEELRDAVIQRFEYTFELCWKLIKRRLELDLAVPSEVDAMSYKVMMRIAFERGLIRNVEAWFVYRSQRNITSHTYSREKAESVYQTALEFAGDARSLLQHLEAVNADPSDR